MILFYGLLRGLQDVHDVDFPEEPLIFDLDIHLNQTLLLGALVLKGGLFRKPLRVLQVDVMSRQVASGVPLKLLFEVGQRLLDFKDD